MERATPRNPLPLLQLQPRTSLQTRSSFSNISAGPGDHSVQAASNTGRTVPRDPLRGQDG
ncbi:MAG: hypothetical protein MZU95_05665 [Desulfomicrobium escambiense]|nr:hypothetical protein [Desulfomicrobium escambiense]